ncbi:MAG: LPS O-antigen length regulator [Oleiphilus sp.]|nr:MAG: LPS O-antigen length regulator [Oleiphilus sp.]
MDQKNQVPQAPCDDEIDLLELWRALWHGKWIIIVFTAAFSIASVFYAMSLPNMYKSTAVLAPAESSSSGLNQLAGQFGGLASLAGINIGGGSSNKTAEALEILQSWAFIEEFIQEQNIAPQVFAAKGWNPDTNELVYDNETFDPKTQVWTREPPEGKQAAPSSWELFEKFGEYMSVSEDKVSGFTSISIEHYSPEIAKLWVDALVKKINTKLQVRDSKEAETNVAFLKQQIEQTPLASMQSVFYDLIEEQTKTLMLAKGSAEYVFKTVSQSRVAEQKSNPKRALICIFGAMLGSLLGCIIALVRGLKRH